MANYIIDNNAEYDNEIRRLEDTDPARAETVFNPLFSKIINNVQALKNMHEKDSELLFQTIYNLSNDVSTLAFELAMNGYINTDGMKQVVVDKFESTDDLNLISGRFNSSLKKVYI